MPATSTDRLSNLTTSVAVKAPVRAVTTANITLAGLQIVGGVSVVEGNRVLVRLQTDSKDNGIYVASTGDWQRAQDFDGNRDAVQGTLVIRANALGRAVYYQLTTADPVIIGTSDITFALSDDPSVIYGLTDAEGDAGLTADDIVPAYPELDIRRYGGVADGDDGTDNFTAFNNARIVVEQKGGGTIRIEGGGTFWCSNHCWVDSSHTHVCIEPGTTLSTTEPTTSGGTLVFMGPNVLIDDFDTLIEDVGVYGGGTVRNSSISAAITGITKANPAVVTAPGHGFAAWPVFQRTRVRILGALGMVEINNDELNGTGDAADEVEYEITVIDANSFSLNGVDSTAFTTYTSGGTASFANENAVAFVACRDFYCIGMNLPESNRKAIAAQTNIDGGWILNNKIGVSGHTGIECKGATASGQITYKADNILIAGNVVEDAGQLGIEVEQPSFGDDNLLNNRIIDNTVKSSVGTGIRMRRSDQSVCRGNVISNSGSNNYHFSDCVDLRGDAWGENAGDFGVHMQDCDNWDLTSVTVRNPTLEGFREADDLSGGRIGRLVVKGSVHTSGYRATNRLHAKPVTINSWDVDAGAGVAFMGSLPTLMPNIVQSKLQSFVLLITNDGGTIKHRFVGDVVQGSATLHADRITGATDTLTATPVGADASTAMANGGKIGSANTNEFVLDCAGTLLGGSEIGSASIELNSSTVALRVALVRRSINVNGTTKHRYHLRFTVDATGATYNLTTLGSGLMVDVRVLVWAP